MKFLQNLNYKYLSLDVNCHLLVEALNQHLVSLFLKYFQVLEKLLTHLY